jgi:hypothetical protein
VGWQRFERLTLLILLFVWQIISFPFPQNPTHYLWIGIETRGPAFQEHFNEYHYKVQSHRQRQHEYIRGRAEYPVLWPPLLLSAQSWQVGKQFSALLQSTTFCCFRKTAPRRGPEQRWPVSLISREVVDWTDRYSMVMSSTCQLYVWFL